MEPQVAAPVLQYHHHHQQQALATADSDSASGLWVFGYGSLCWHPGFEFRRSVTGYVTGYARKFWQGNTTHRGTESQVSKLVTYDSY